MLLVDREVAELVIISNHTSLTERETALLACVGYGVPSVEITWVYNGQAIMNSSLVSISEEDVVYGERIFRQSFLQLCSVNLRDSGAYTCIVSNGRMTVNASSELSVSGKFDFHGVVQFIDD